MLTPHYTCNHANSYIYIFVNIIVVLVGKRQSADPQCEEVLPSACADIVAADPSVCAKECLYKKCPVACGHCSEYFFRWKILRNMKTFALKIRMYFEIYYLSYLSPQSHKNISVKRLTYSCYLFFFWWFYFGWKRFRKSFYSTFFLSLWLIA